MQLNSYWLSTAPSFSGGQQAFTQEHYDVAVVGGGFTGLSAARTLARGGARVALLEAGQLIGEASGRNGGQCNTGVAQDYANLVEQLGRERAIAHYTTYAEARRTTTRPDQLRRDGLHNRGGVAVSGHEFYGSV